jgi:putative transcriptional regulator
MIVNFVTKWREAKGVSKAHLARRVGVSRSYVTKLEQGIMQPSGELMFRIAKYLGQPLESVFQPAPAKTGGNFFSALVMPDRQMISHPCPAADRNNKQCRKQ